MKLVYPNSFPFPKLAIILLHRLGSFADKSHVTYPEQILFLFVAVKEIVVNDLSVSSKGVAELKLHGFRVMCFMIICWNSIKWECDTSDEMSLLTWARSCRERGCLIKEQSYVGMHVISFLKFNYGGICETMRPKGLGALIILRIRFYFMRNSRSHEYDLSLAFCPGSNTFWTSSQYGLYIVVRKTSTCTI